MPKFVWWLIGLVVVIAAVAIRYFLIRRRETVAQEKGVAVYATVVSIDMTTFLGKPSPMSKIKMWLQEPGQDRREVVLQSRIPAGQRIGAGVMLPVVIDPTDPKRIYPAGPAAMKRVQLTGSRDTRRQMKRQGL
jgi:hypothetical protein